MQSATAPSAPRAPGVSTSGNADPADSIIRARTNARYAADSDGTGDTLRLANSNTNRLGPQYGRERRSSNNVASTAAGI